MLGVGQGLQMPQLNLGRPPVIGFGGGFGSSASTPGVPAAVGAQPAPLAFYSENTVAAGGLFPLKLPDNLFQLPPGGAAASPVPVASAEKQVPPEQLSQSMRMAPTGGARGGTGGFGSTTTAHTVSGRNNSTSYDRGIPPSAIVEVCELRDIVCQEDVEESASDFCINKSLSVPTEVSVNGKSGFLEFASIDAAKSFLDHAKASLVISGQNYALRFWHEGGFYQAPTQPAVPLHSSHHSSQRGVGGPAPATGASCREGPVHQHPGSRRGGDPPRDAIANHFRDEGDGPRHRPAATTHTTSCRSEATNTIILKGLPVNCREADVVALFAGAPVKVAQTRIMPNKSFGFAEFTTTQDGILAAEHLDRVWHRRPEVGGRKVDYDFALSQQAGQAGPNSVSLVMGPKWSNLHTSQTIGRVAEQFASGIANATEKAASRTGVNAGMWSSYLQKNKLQEEKVSGAANASVLREGEEAAFGTSTKSCFSRDHAGGSGDHERSERDRERERNRDRDDRREDRNSRRRKSRDRRGNNDSRRRDEIKQSARTNKISRSGSRPRGNNRGEGDRQANASTSQTSYVLDPEGSGFKYSAREQLYYDEQSAVFFTHVNARGNIAGTCFKYDCAAQLLVECQPREPYEVLPEDVKPQRKTRPLVRKSGEGAERGETGNRREDVEGAVGRRRKSRSRSRERRSRSREREIGRRRGRGGERDHRDKRREDSRRRDRDLRRGTSPRGRGGGGRDGREDSRAPRGRRESRPRQTREKTRTEQQPPPAFSAAPAGPTGIAIPPKSSAPAPGPPQPTPLHAQLPVNSASNGNNSAGNGNLINGAAGPTDVQQMQQAMQQQQEAMQQMQALHNLQLQYMQMQMMMAQQGQQQQGPVQGSNMMPSMAATGMGSMGGVVSMGGMGGMGMQSSAANGGFGSCVNGGAVVPGGAGFSGSGQGSGLPTQRNKGKGKGKQIQLNLMQPSSMQPSSSYHGSNASMQSGASYNSSNSSGVADGGGQQGAVEVDTPGASKWRVQQGDGKWVCTLCKRQFETLEHVLRHEQKSDLHRKNLEKESMAGA